MVLNRKALAASFSVYLLPIFTIHYVYFWGWGIGSEVFAGTHYRTPLWLAGDAVLALGFQAAAYFLCIWMFSGRWWRWLSLPPAAGTFWVALNALYTFVLQTHL